MAQFITLTTIATIILLPTILATLPFAPAAQAAPLLHSSTPLLLFRRQVIAVRKRVRSPLVCSFLSRRGRPWHSLQQQQQHQRLWRDILPSSDSKSNANDNMGHGQSSLGRAPSTSSIAASQSSHGNQLSADEDERSSPSKHSAAPSSSPSTPTSVASSVTSSVTPSSPRSAPASPMVAATKYCHEDYRGKPDDVHPRIHYVFLVHGWLGNELEMSYLSEAFQEALGRKRRRLSHLSKNSNQDANENSNQDQNQDQNQDLNENGGNNENVEILIHSVKCNVGKTHDGIRMGGIRLANEIIDFIRSDFKFRENDGSNSTKSNDTNNEVDQQHVTFSIVGNSLGGLYARYALALIPYELHLTQPPPSKSSNHNNENANESTQQQKTDKSTILHLHPNIFCTTATPHLGIAGQTYLRIPRFAETLIGKGMGATGRDLFRMNSKSFENRSSFRNNSFPGSATSLEEDRGFGRSFDSTDNDDNNNDHNGDTNDSDDNRGNIYTTGNIDKGSFDSNDESECIIRNMCLDAEYLTPLSNFRHRIAYANVYGTDFQVPTETAAFLNRDSDVLHEVLAVRKYQRRDSRDANRRNTHGDKRSSQRGIIKRLSCNSMNARDFDSDDDDDNNNGEDDKLNQEEMEEQDGKVPPFIVAILRTETQSNLNARSQSEQSLKLQPRLNTSPELSPKSSSSASPLSPSSSRNQQQQQVQPSDLLLTPSKELLLMSKSLDALGWTKILIDVRNRIPLPGISKPSWLPLPSLQTLDDLIQERGGGDRTIGSTTVGSATTSSISTDCFLKSREVAKSTTFGDSIHFPLGHTVMVANSKSEAYSKINSQGRPVMNRLARNIVDLVFEF